MTSTTPAPNTHIYLLLDRSGSMQSIASDVVGGFNRFIKDQAALGTDVSVTLVQFDSQDPQEVLAAGVPIAQIEPLTLSTFNPRGSTPLLDATGRLIGRARLNQEVRAANSLPTEDIVFVTVTDGEENESHEFTLRKIQELITQCERDGWTFVFLSAALDAYGDAARIGVKNGNIQAFDASGDGASLAFSSLSKNLSTRRMKMANGTIDVNDDFFEVKEAEDHRNTK